MTNEPGSSGLVPAIHVSPGARQAWMGHKDGHDDGRRDES
jgi:hypothetical protein